MHDEPRGPENIDLEISDWSPTGKTNEDEASLQKILSEASAIKETHLRTLSRPGEPRLTPEQIDRSLIYLETRMRALKPGDAIIIARMAGKIVGLILNRWEDAEKRTRMEQFYVDLNQRGGGIGSRILDSAVRQAQNARPKKSRGIFLTTGKTNMGAQKLYARFGFHESTIPPSDSREIRLEKDF
jgi:ribosomal protein S18 acetylase RimI-like enzyme